MSVTALDKLFQEAHDNPEGGIYSVVMAYVLDIQLRHFKEKCIADGMTEEEASSAVSAKCDELLEEMKKANTDD